MNGMVAGLLMVTTFIDMAINQKYLQFNFLIMAYRHFLVLETNEKTAKYAKFYLQVQYIIQKL